MASVDDRSRIERNKNDLVVVDVAADRVAGFADKVAAFGQ